jgi:hypothetical protein
MSRAPDGGVLLCRLCERQAASGRRCFTGRLGLAKVVAFLDHKAEPKFGATAYFNVSLEPGEDREAAADAAENRSHWQPRVQRRKPPAEPAAELLPNDTVADLWAEGGDA